MATLTPEQLRSELESGRQRPVYLLLGAESFLREEALESLRTYAFARTVRDFNYDSYDVREGQLEHALATARTLPMMGALRLVLLRGLDGLLGQEAGRPKGEGGKKRSQVAQELLEAYLDGVEPRTMLVLSAEKADRRRKSFKQLDAVGAVVELKDLKPRQVPDWITARAKSMGLRLEGATPHLLADVLGTDLGTIVRSLEKLQLYVGERGVVQPADVETCVARTKVHAVFELMDAVGRRQTDRALTLLHRMIENREAPLMILAMVTRQIRRIWVAASLLHAGVPKRDLADRLGLLPFLVDDLCRQADLFDRPDLVRAMDLLFETDRALKTSGGDPERVMELLVLGLCAGSARRAA
jgi:DNA polymerase-3 subunit delta